MLVRPASLRHKCRPEVATDTAQATARQASACLASRAKGRDSYTSSIVQAAWKVRRWQRPSSSSFKALKPLTSVHQFHIIFFNQQMRHFDLSGGGRRVAFATDRNKNLAARFVGGITADGGTDRLPALRAAVQMNPDVIFFLTDADDPMPRSELAEIAELNGTRWRRDLDDRIRSRAGDSVEKLPHRTRTDHWWTVRLRRYDEAGAAKRVARPRWPG